VAVLITFFLAMMLHPEAQAKAQQEIDAVIGTAGRVINHSDQDSLPYVVAVMKEVFRWSPIIPLGKILNDALMRIKFLF